MSTFLIIVGIIVCVVVALALFTNIGADYTKKTDQQLLSTWRLHEVNVNAARKVGPEKYKQAVEKMSTLTNEMKRRGLLPEDYTIENELLDSYSRTKFSRSLDEIKVLANENDPQALYQLGMLFHSTKELTTAFRYLLKSAELNCPDAQYALGWAFLQGIGVMSDGKDAVPLDGGQALKWLKVAADHGHSDAERAIKVATQSIPKAEIDLAFEEARQWTQARTKQQLTTERMPSRPAPAESHLHQLAATKLRAAAEKAYEATFFKGKAQGKSETVCHEVSVMNVLVSQYREALGDENISQDQLKMIAIEATPFMKLLHIDGKISAIEYAVWKAYPTLANENLISSAVKRMKSNLASELLASLDGAPFPWVRFL